ncbi:MAG: HAMP domain-containing sensor histidine kinase [Paludibacter sp.]|nr:HAMP domain-containing sensor histidine kinase [Paludibacter sp.]
MRYKRLTQLSICFVILIFLSQAFLIFRLFQINKELLNRELNLVSQEAYNLDMNTRINTVSLKDHPTVSIEDPKKKIELEPGDKFCNIDAIPGIDRSNSMTLINIGMEMFLSKKKPIQLQVIDSIASALLSKDDIHSALYSRIVDTKNNKILASTQKNYHSSSLLIKSKNIPLNFQQTKVLQIVLLNPMRDIFSQMTGILAGSFLLSLFCIYCLFVLQRTLARQKKLAQSKNDFYNQVSHELKRPISVMYKAVDSLLNTKAIDDPKKREKYLGVSMDELNRMNGKIDMILTLSMEEEGMFNLNLSDFNLVDLIQELKERFLGVASKPINIRIENLLNKPFITADRDHLYQCISNLMENAIKYSEESVDISMKLTEENGSVLIAVQDNGSGIKKEDLGKIFEKFARVNTDKKMHGFGIGLSYVKQIIEKHGGRISVKSEPGKGSEFILQIPKIQTC